MEITFYLINQSKKFQDINDRFIDLSNHYVNSLLHFLNIKLIFEFLKTIGRVEVLVVYLRREIGKNVIKYIHVYNVDI